MFKNPEEIKKFILWCKDQKIKKGSVGEISFEFTDIALLTDEDLEALNVSAEKELSNFNTPTFGDDEESQLLQDQKEYDELLYWSTNPPKR